MDNCSEYSRLVSFVLPHHGREPLLLQTIESIFQQDIDVQLVEVIVVSKAVFADTDPLLLKLAEFGVKDRVRFVTIPQDKTCLLYTSPSPRDRQKSRMPSSA